MNDKKIRALVESKKLSMDEVQLMNGWTRQTLGLPVIIPEVDYSGTQRFVENYLPRWQVLRRMFGLDQTLDIEPPFQFDEPNMGRNYSWYNAQLQFELNRRSVYHLVEEMDNFDLVSSALDIWAEEATQTDNDTGKVVWIECDDIKIKKELMDLLERLNMEDLAFGLVRQMCVAEGSMVWTVSGPKPIEDVEPGEHVQGYKNGSQEYFRVTNRFDNGKRNVLRIKTKHREVFVTADHRMLVRRGADGPIEWVHAEDLVVKRFGEGSRNRIDQKNTDRLIASSSTHTGKRLSWESIGCLHTPPALSLDSAVEPWVCRLLGFLWGDGFMGSTDLGSSSTQTFYSRGVYEDQNDYYDSLLEDLGLNPVLEEQHSRTAVASIQFKKFLLELGWVNGASDKRIPRWLGLLPWEHRKEFLDGFMDADGWVSQQSSWTRPAKHFEIANAPLARGLKALIDGLGFRSGNLRVRERNPEGRTIKGKEVQSFQPTSTLTYSEFTYGPGFFDEAILSIEPAGEVQVYDLEVDDEASNFVVDGVVVHNCKYGDDFEQVIASTSKGIVQLKFTQPQRLTRIEDRLGRLEGFAPGIHTDFEINDPEAKAKMRKSKPWDFIHWRLTSSRREMHHGESILMAARRTWRQLKIIEDSLVLYRLNRATDKDVYYIDVGNQSPDQQWQTVHRFRRELRKKFYVNTQTNTMRQQYNPRTADEDLYIPLPKDSATRIERLAGANPQGDIYDVDHFRNKFFAAVRIPKAFMGYEEDVNAKATLVSQDIRFARGIKRVQRAFRSGVVQLCKIHLALRGHQVQDENGEDIIKFKVRMAPINYLDELARSELWQIKQEIAQLMLQLAQPMGNPIPPEPEPPEPPAGANGAAKSGSNGKASSEKKKPASKSKAKAKSKKESAFDEEFIEQPGQVSVIKNVDGWVSWVLRKFLGLTDDEMELFMGDPNAGRTREQQTLKDISETRIRAAVAPLGKRIEKLRAAFTTLHEDATIRTSDPLPAKLEREPEIYDVESEEKKLMEVLGKTATSAGLAIQCPACKEGALETRFDEGEDRMYLLCTHTKSGGKQCGFVAWAEDPEDGV